MPFLAVPSDLVDVGAACRLSGHASACVNVSADDYAPRVSKPHGSKDGRVAQRKVTSVASCTKTGIAELDGATFSVVAYSTDGAPEASFYGAVAANLPQTSQAGEHMGFL
eukprot:9472630-Pyramimonas_sp.AAC.1